MNKGIWVSDHEFKSFSESATRISTREIATRQNNPFDFTMMGYLPDPDPVLRKLGKDISVYRELLSDAHVFSVVQQRKAGVLSLDWEIDRGKTKSRVAKSVESMLRNQIRPHRIMNQALECLSFGFQPLEVVWATARNEWRIQSVEAKPQEWFSFDENNQLVLDYGRRGLKRQDPLPDHSFILARNNPSYINPYGDKLLSRVFWPVTFKRGGLKFWVTFTEKYGMPYMVGKVPRGTSQEIMDDLADKLENMVQDAIAVIYNDQSTEILDAKSVQANATIFENLINYCDREISKAYLTQTLTTDNTGGNGSNALGQTQAEKLSQVNDGGDKAIVEETIQTIIDWYCQFNFGSNESPRFTLYEEEDVDKNLADRDAVLVEKLGVRFTPDYIAHTYNIDPKFFTIIGDSTQLITSPTENTPNVPMLNGAQIQAATAVVQSVSSGDLPRDSGINQLMTFLTLTKDQAEAVMGSAGTGEKIKPDKVVGSTEIKAEPVNTEFRDKGKVIRFKLAEGKTVYPDQETLDSFYDSLSNDETGSEITQKMLLPLINLVERSESFEDLQDRLADIFPEMNDSALQQYLRKAIFLSEVWGRLNGDE